MPEVKLDQDMIVTTDVVTSKADETFTLAADPNRPDAPLIDWDSTISHTFDVVGTYLTHELDPISKLPKEVPFKLDSTKLPEPLRFDDETVARYGGDGAFKNQLAMEIMPLIFPDFKKLRHYRVCNVKSHKRNRAGQEVALDLPTRVVLMDRQQCLEFRDTTSKLSLVEPALYPELADLQTAILECLEDPKGFRNQQNIRKKMQRRHMAGDGVRKTNSSLIDKLKEGAQKKGITPGAHTKASKLNI